MAGKASPSISSRRTSTATVPGIDPELPGKIQEDYLMCKICYDKFAPTPLENLPKSLSCSHTFCSGCMTDFINNRKGRSRGYPGGKFKFPCPLCRKTTWIPKGGPRGLPNNYTVLGLIELLTPPTKSPKKHLTVAGGAVLPPPAAPARINKAPSTTPHIRTSIDSCEAIGRQRPPPFNPEYPERKNLPRFYVGDEAGPSGASVDDHLVKLSPRRGLDRFKRASSMSHKRSQSNVEKLPGRLSEGQLPVRETPAGPQGEGSTPPKPPPRRCSMGAMRYFSADSLKCIGLVGRYSPDHMQTGAFMQPSRIAACATSDHVAVIDSLQMVVQIFIVSASNATYVSMFKVIGLTGICFITANALAVSTHRGVNITSLDGHVQSQVLLERVITVVPYHFGFIAAQSNCLNFYAHDYTRYKHVKKLKRGTFRSKSFHQIQDLAINSHKDLIILDIGAKRPIIYVSNQNGDFQFSIDPRSETCGPFRQPHSVEVDQWNSILVTDCRAATVLKFSAAGVFSKTIVRTRQVTSFTGNQPKSPTSGENWSFSHDTSGCSELNSSASSQLTSAPSQLSSSSGSQLACFGLAITPDNKRLFIVLRSPTEPPVALISIHQLY